MNGSPIKFLIQPTKLGAVERRLANLARVMGAEVAEVALPKDGEIGDSFIQQLVETGALISSADALAALLSRNGAGPASLTSLIRHLRVLLIYGLEQCCASARLLFGHDLIGDAPSPVQNSHHSYHLPRSGSAVSLQLAGISFEADSERPARLMTAISGDRTSRVMDRDGMPFLALLRRDNCELFLLASSEIVDVEAPATGGELPREAYPALLPWLLFIRRAAGERCWRNFAPKACLIIDDPLLRPRYGFLCFAALLESMHRNDFKTTIAFIPWNYTRSVAATTGLFNQNAEMLSLCVHGCDHTDAEFGTANIEVLRQKAHTALERMRFHESATGIKCDRVMVFPQGVFSAQSLLALEAEGYLAAVNSGITSIDRPDLPRIRHLLLPASQAYGGVPLFKRHYPGDVLPFALDLFLGKQVLIVEHHTYFRSGYNEAAAFVAQLRAVEPNLCWSSLGHTLRAAVQHRISGSGNEIRAYTDEVLFEHPGDGSGYCKLIKLETDPEAVCEVLVNGYPAEYRLADDRVEVEFEAQGECRVEVLRRPVAPFRATVPSFASSAKLAARRYLSELRDNALAGNARFLPASIARQFIRVWH